MLQAKTVYSRKVNALRPHTQMPPMYNDYAAKSPMRHKPNGAVLQHSKRITGEYYGRY